jgi:hypothetical protein
MPDECEALSLSPSAHGKNPLSYLFLFFKTLFLKTIISNNCVENRVEESKQDFFTVGYLR